MADATDVFGAAAELDYGNSFSDQFGRSVMQNVRSENTIGFCVRNELDHSFHVVAAKCPAIGAEWKSADPHVDSLLFGLIFGETDAGELGIRVNDPGNGFVV